MTVAGVINEAGKIMIFADKRIMQNDNYLDYSKKISLLENKIYFMFAGYYNDMVHVRKKVSKATGKEDLLKILNEIETKESMSALLIAEDYQLKATFYEEGVEVQDVQSQRYALIGSAKEEVIAIFKYIEIQGKALTNEAVKNAIDAASMVNAGISQVSDVIVIKTENE